MPVPSSINDLSTSEGANSPTGTDAPSSLDNHIRALASFIAQLRDAAANYVSTSGAQTIAGVKTFSSTIVGSISGNAATATNATNATTAANCSRNVNTSGLASGGGALTADRTITVTVASQAQAEAGTDNTTAMTPLRTAQAISAQANVMAITAAQATGAVGTYAFCRGAAASPGSLYAGSGLNYTGGVVETVSSPVGSGTWRAMGYTSVSDRGTLYLRVA